MEEESAKSSVLKNVKLKKRVKSSKYRKPLGPPAWNERFTLEKMPDYNAYRDQYAAAFVALLKRSDVKYASAKRVTKFVPVQENKAFKRPRTSQTRHQAKSSKVSQITTQFSHKNYSSPKSPLRSISKPPLSAQSKLLSPTKTATAQRTSFYKSSFPETSPARSKINSKRSLTPSSQIFPTKQKRKLKLNQEEVQKLREELENQWKLCKVPIYHQQIFIRSLHGLSPDLFIPLIIREIQDLHREKAPIQSVIKGIVAREECLQYIQEMERVLERKKEDSHLTKQLLEECVELLHSLRILSLNAVECTVRWRERLLQTFALSEIDSPFKVMGTIPFIWGDTNYLTKIKIDNVFLQKSAYSDFFNFSLKSDPFLLIPSTIQPTRKKTPLRRAKEANQSKWIVPLHPSLLKRVRACETVIIQETMSEQLAFQTLGGLQGIQKNLMKFEPPSRSAYQTPHQPRQHVRKEVGSFGVQAGQKLVDKAHQGILIQDRNKEEETPSFKIDRYEGAELKKLSNFKVPPNVHQSYPSQESKTEEKEKSYSTQERQKTEQIEEKSKATQEEVESVQKIEEQEKSEEEEEYGSEGFEEVKVEIATQSQGTGKVSDIKTERQNPTDNSQLTQAQKEEHKSQEQKSEIQELTQEMKKTEEDAPTQRRVQMSNRSLDPRISDQFESHMTPRKNDSTTPNFDSFHRNATETMSESLAPIQMGSRSSRKKPPKFQFDEHNESKMSFMQEGSARGLNRIFQEKNEEDKAYNMMGKNPSKTIDFSDKIIKECLNAPDILIWKERPSQNDVDGLLLNYIENVHPKLSKSFLDVSKLLEVVSASKNQLKLAPEPGWLFFSDKKGQSLHGLVVFAGDPKNLSRVNIFHFSAVEHNILSPVLAKSLHYIWQNIDCSEIRIGLNYYQEEGKGEVINKELQDLLMMEFGFKWKTMMFDTFSGKKMVLGVSRPKQISFKNFRNLPKRASNFNFRSRGLLALESPDFEDQQEGELDQEGSLTLNYLAILPLLEKFEVKEGNFSTMIQRAHQSQNSLFYSEKSEQEMNLSTPADLTKLKNFENFEKQVGKLRNPQNGKICVGEHQIQLSLNAFSYSDLMIEGELFHYVRLNKVKMGKSNQNCSIFLLTTSDPNYQIFVIDIQKAEDKVLLELKENFNSKLHLLLSEISQSKTTDEGTDLWLPCFKAKRKNTLASNLAQGNILLENEEERIVSQAKDIMTVEIPAWQSLSCNLQIEPTASSSVIQDNFILGVLNEGVDEFLSEPIVALYVFKREWSRLHEI